MTNEIETQRHAGAVVFGPASWSGRSAESPFVIRYRSQITIITIYYNRHRHQQLHRLYFALSRSLRNENNNTQKMDHHLS